MFETIMSGIVLGYFMFFGSMLMNKALRLNATKHLGAAKDWVLRTVRSEHNKASKKQQDNKKD